MNTKPFGKTGANVSVIGQGTWYLDHGDRKRAIAALQRGLDLGMTHIDTAEMYGDAELVIADAIAGRRDEVFLVSKVYPHNASRKAMRHSCTASLKRLKTGCLDLYLLHWSGAVPIEETVEAFERLREEGLIRQWGVSNLDIGEMEALWELSDGQAAQTDQVHYNLTRRGIEWNLLPWLRERSIPVMAYSPIEQGRLARQRKLVDFGKHHGITPAQAALAWVLAQDGVIAIPKTASVARLHENAEVLARPLDAAALAELDTLFPPPKGPVPLEML